MKNTIWYLCNIPPRFLICKQHVLLTLTSTICREVLMFIKYLWNGKITEYFSFKITVNNDHTLQELRMLSSVTLNEWMFCLFSIVRNVINFHKVSQVARVTSLTSLTSLTKITQVSPFGIQILDQLNIFQSVSGGLKQPYLAETPKGAVLENGDVVLRKVVIRCYIKIKISLLYFFIFVTLIFDMKLTNTKGWK